MMNFREQSEVWLRDLESRKRKPVSPATLRTFRNHVRILVGIVGDVPLAEVNNGTAKSVAANLCEQGYAPKTTNEILSALKSVVASAVNLDTGESLYPRTWNVKYIDAPVVANQKQPCLTRSEIESLITHAKSDQEKLFYCVLAGTGLRVSEALAIHVSGSQDQTSWDHEDSAIRVRSRMYRDEEQNRLKTPAARRDVDLHPALNALLVQFVAMYQIRPGEFLFQSRTGASMNLVTATLRLSKHGCAKGFHSFRRFRITTLRGLGIPEEILRAWVGHSCNGITDKYSKLAEDVGLRKLWAKKVLGFALPKLPQFKQAVTADVVNASAGATLESKAEALYEISAAGLKENNYNPAANGEGDRTLGGFARGRTGSMGQGSSEVGGRAGSETAGKREAAEVGYEAETETEACYVGQ